MNNNKMYVIVREDISSGYQLAQSNHVSFKFASQYPEVVINWIQESEYIAVLKIENKEKLRNLYLKSLELGLRTSLFEEPDLNNEMTAICIEPNLLTKKLVSNLKRA